jgi:hypothetical protein
MKAIKILIYYLFKRNEGKNKAARQQGSKAARQQGSKAARQQGSKAARQQGSKAARQQGSKAKIMALLYTMQVMYDILLN